MPETILEELKRYVGFGPGDEAALRALYPAAEPHFVRIADVFYRRILDHAEARTALEGGETQVGRLKVTLVQWMGQLLQGPWDDAYYEMRARIGRVHVRIRLDQHYMFGAMNVIRRELNDLIDATYLKQPGMLAAARSAVGRILDLELAVMLHTYREDLLSQNAKAERLATFGQLVGSIGHELRNPLGVMESSLYILKGRVGEDERGKKHIERIAQQLGIANSIIADLLDLIRDKPLQRESVKVAGVIAAAIGQVKKPDGVEIRLAGLDALPELQGDAGQLRQVFTNLIDNAVHAAEPKGEVRITGEATLAHVNVAVEDTGAGVDSATRKRLFEPLVTTKTKGVGLGLALVKRVVERHQGTVTYEPRDAGARFVVRFPRPA